MSPYLGETQTYIPNGTLQGLIEDKYGSLENARRAKSDGRKISKEHKQDILRLADQTNITNAAIKWGLSFATVFHWYHITYGFTRAIDKI